MGIYIILRAVERHPFVSSGEVSAGKARPEAKDESAGK
jgi:hypothetical protein